MELGKKSQMRGGLYLDICVWVPEFLVTPLLMGPVCLLRARPPLIVTVLAIRAIYVPGHRLSPLLVLVRLHGTVYTRPSLECERHRSCFQAFVKKCWVLAH